MRLILAIQCFFALLFSGKVPAKALPPPPEGAEEEKKKAEAERARLANELEEAKASAGALRSEKDALAKELADAKAAAAEAGAAKGEAEKLAARVKEVEGELEEAMARTEKLKEDKQASEGKLKDARDHGVLAVLAWLQREGRLIDFLKEDIDEYEDEQVGAAVRAIHKGCLKVLTEGFDLESILEGEEESPVKVDEGFDPVAIQLTGNVKGDPPFKGTLMHHGWRAKSVSVPVPETVDPHVLAPAEVEL